MKKLLFACALFSSIYANCYVEVHSKPSYEPLVEKRATQKRRERIVGINLNGFGTFRFPYAFEEMREESVYSFIGSMGFNGVRVTVCPSVLTYEYPKNTSSVLSLNPHLKGFTMKEAFLRVLRRLKEKGLYIVVSLHNLRCDCKVRIKASEYMEVLDFWVRFKKEVPSYLYDAIEIWNEPEGDNGELYSKAKFLLDSLRKLFPYKEIIVGGGYVFEGKDYGWGSIPLIRGGDVHHYPFSKDQVSTIIKLADSFDVKWVTELGTGKYEEGFKTLVLADSGRSVFFWALCRRCERSILSHPAYILIAIRQTPKFKNAVEDSPKQDALKVYAEHRE